MTGVRHVFRWFIAGGVVTAGFAWAAAPAGAGTTAVSINFDGFTAPCTFDQTVALTTQYSRPGVRFSGPGASHGGGEGTAPGNVDQTVALTTQYSSQGVRFSGPGAYNGGGVLNECGNFGVSGYSAPNFLAFNNGAHFINGGTPVGPELILFTTATYDHVQINVACVAGGQARLQAFDSNKQVIATSIINLSSTLATVSVDDPNGRASIKAVKLMTNQSVWVADDLSASYLRGSVR